MTTGEKIWNVIGWTYLAIVVAVFTSGIALLIRQVIIDSNSIN